MTAQYRKITNQVMLIAGLVGVGVYCARFSLWPVLIPTAFAATCMVYLTLYKVYLEVIKSRKDKRLAKITVAPRATVDDNDKAEPEEVVIPVDHVQLFYNWGKGTGSGKDKVKKTKSNSNSSGRNTSKALLERENDVLDVSNRSGLSSKSGDLPIIEEGHRLGSSSELSVFEQPRRYDWRREDSGQSAVSDKSSKIMSDDDDEERG